MHWQFRLIAPGIFSGRYVLTQLLEDSVDGSTYRATPGVRYSLLFWIRPPPAALSPSDSSETASGRDAERQGQTLELLRWGYLSSLRGHLEDIKPNLGIH